MKNQNKELEKPTMEKYGWHEQSGYEDLPSGWMFEGGEEAYYKALKEWDCLQIKDWLAADSKTIWKQGENPNCFTSNKLEVLHVYDGYIKYWEDIRHQSVFSEHKIPNIKSELYLITSSNHRTSNE